ncbi:hypothetical protein Fot_00219 [Forsythia ovata]|uniref:RAB6-interacting golgin n=1 Tax=Forsythia ovata TaxID=205694 RepID=A0ABD1X0J8_9LAMI
MSGFHFSKVPKFKIRRGGIVEDVPHPHLAPSGVSGSGPTVFQGPETAVGHPPVSPASGVRVDVLFSTDPASRGSPAGNVRSSAGKRPKVESGEQASRTPVSPPPGRREYINIGARQDELDPSVVEKLPSAMLEMRVAEIQSALGEDENAEVMRAEIKRLRARLAFSEDARSRATYDVTKAQTIQKACIVAQKKAESQLKSCQNMIQAKDRELTEVSNELAKAKGLLAKLGVPGYTKT